MLVVVTGGRNFTDLACVGKALEQVKPSRIYHGGARGADRIAAGWACEHSVVTRVFHPDWANYPKLAGPRRNQEMLEAAKIASETDGLPLCLLHFPGGAGTADCVRRARGLGIPILDGWVMGA